MLRCPACAHENPADATDCVACRATLRARADATLDSKSEGMDPIPPRGAHGRFQAGHRLGKRYRIVGLIGRGGMGEVYRADDLEMGQPVALKFLPEYIASSPAALQRVRQLGPRAAARVHGSDLHRARARRMDVPGRPPDPRRNAR